MGGWCAVAFIVIMSFTVDSRRIHEWDFNKQLFFLAASQSSTVSSAPSTGRQPDLPPRPFQRQGSQQQQQSVGEDTEDTMKNLRKTFAGIFGDM